MSELLIQALSDQIWVNHNIGDQYLIGGDKDKWKIAYYPIFENGKTGLRYDEPRALMEKPIIGGTDFREMPLRYITKQS